jgi:hypothetical protein
MKIAPTHYVRFLVCEDKWIVTTAVKLDFQSFFGIKDALVTGPVDLSDAAHRVWVLDIILVLYIVSHWEQVSHKLSDYFLPVMDTNLLNTVVKGIWVSFQSKET